VSWLAPVPDATPRARLNITSNAMMSRTRSMFAEMMAPSLLQSGANDFY